jgi:hypothetical protein
MSLRRVSPILGRLLLLALLVTIVPACKKKSDPAPHITDSLPLFDAAGVPHFPQMVIEWDKALDPTTINANIKIYLTDVFGNHTVPWGGTYTITYLPGKFQTVINNSTAMGNGTTATEYAIVVFPGLLAANGNPVNAFATGSIADRFFVGTNANLNQPSFTAPAQNVGPGGAGGIAWTWTQASEGGPITATYDFYMSTASGGQDLLDLSPDFTSVANTGATMTGLVTGTTYYFRVICRDSAGNTTMTAEFTGVPD